MNAAAVRRHATLLTVAAGLCIGTATLFAQAAPKITSAKALIGFNIGDDYQMASYTQLETLWKKWAAESDRMKLVDIGPTEEGRPQYMAVITSPENLKKIEHYRQIAAELAHGRLTEQQAHALAREGKAVVWEDGGLHASETVGSQQLMEMVYEMVSRNDPETLRLLDDDILLAVQANPDGQEIVAKWYMREADPAKRELQGLPVLYNKYIGHDDNRDFFSSNMKETTNMNKVMFIDWFPQIVYNHHQPGFNQTGGVIFMPPFRDPFNYHFDPLIPVGIEEVASAMHARLIANGMPGSGMRTYSNYSTWWNGGLRTIGYFHNVIGLLTEIIGSPTPVEIPLIPDRQLPHGDLPFPVPPQTWHYRQSIDYDVQNNRAVLDYASRNRETLLYDMYVMAHRAIEAGSHDSWTITPKRIAALKAAAQGESETEGIRQGTGRAVPTSLYETVLHDPKFRDPRGYIIPSDQPDFLTATKFVNALIKTGVEVMRATSSFQVAGKNYPAGSYVVKTDQAYRAHVLDMFEPQDHPNDFQYPGGPPIPPYDITGWTLAMQMGVQYDRVLDGFTGPFVGINGTAEPPAAAIGGAANPAGYLISHETNDQFIVVNRLLKAGAAVYWVGGRQTADGEDLGTGAVWVPASAAVRPILETAAKTLGVSVHGVGSAPTTTMLKLKAPRIALVDVYGGLMPVGWARWLFEQYEFPYERIYPQTLDAGNLNAKYDVIVFMDGAYRRREASRAGEMRAGSGEGLPPGMDASMIPPQYRSWLGRVSEDKTVPQLKQFVAAGGTVVAVGSSSNLGELLGVPVTSHLTEIDHGVERPLAADKFYIPGSLLSVSVDNADPLAYGMPDQVDIVYDNSPVFRMDPDAAQRSATAVAWFAGPKVLESGWAWGQQYLEGGAEAVDASVGRGKVILLGPKVTFRGQPHGTFKLLFNGVLLGAARSAGASADGAR
jgi:hypothetical protein